MQVQTRPRSSRPAIKGKIETPPIRTKKEAPGVIATTVVRAVNNGTFKPGHYYDLDLKTGDYFERSAPPAKPLLQGRSLLIQPHGADNRLNYMELWTSRRNPPFLLSPNGETWLDGTINVQNRVLNQQHGGVEISTETLKSSVAALKEELAEELQRRLGRILRLKT